MITVSLIMIHFFPSDLVIMDKSLYVNTWDRFTTTSPSRSQSLNIKLNTTILQFRTKSILDSGKEARAYINCMKRQNNSDLLNLASEIELFLKPLINEISNITTRKNSSNYMFTINWFVFCGHSVNTLSAAGVKAAKVKKAIEEPKESYC